jgi:hypothetical protein
MEESRSFNPAVAQQQLTCIGPPEQDGSQSDGSATPQIPAEFCTAHLATVNWTVVFRTTHGISQADRPPVGP